MRDDNWADGQEFIEEFDLNVGGLVGAVASIEGTGQLITGTRNDEAQFRLGGGSGGVAAQSPLADRLTVHSIRDVDGRILGLGPRQRNAEGGMDVQDNGASTGVGGGGRGWEPVVEAWTVHEGAVTGIDVVGEYGDLGGVSGVVTAGGDGHLRLFELTLSDSFNPGADANGSAGSTGSSRSPFSLKGHCAAHTTAAARATGVAASRSRAVTVGEDGVACVVDLHRLDGEGVNGFGSGSGSSGGGGGSRGGDCATWRGKAKGGLPLSGVTFQGENDEVFATVGCDPRGQLKVWDVRTRGDRPVHSNLGRAGGSDAPYLCVTSQPFNPDVFACGVSTGEVLLWDVRVGAPIHELENAGDGGGLGGGTWGVAFHPRRPRHLFSCTGTGVVHKWLLPPDANSSEAMPLSSNAGRFGAGAAGVSRRNGQDDSLVWKGGRKLRAIPSRTALVGVCYDEEADTVSAVSKHGHVVVAHGIQGLRL